MWLNKRACRLLISYWCNNVESEYISAVRNVIIVQRVLDGCMLAGNVTTGGQMARERLVGVIKMARENVLEFKEK